MRLPAVALACVLVVLLFVGCGENNSAATSLVRRYEEAILSRDGDSLCATFAPKLREVLQEQITSEQAAGTSGRPRLDCGAFYHLVIGYSHENVDRRFVAGKLLEVGSPRQITRDGVVYAKVPAKLRIEFAYTGYSTRDGGKGSATVEDTVWLSKGKDGSWGVVKPSLALLAASNPDLLYKAYSVAHANAAPPDPDYSMNRAERTAWEAADYRTSFRRDVRHAPLRCGGASVSVADPPNDGVTYPTGSALHPVAAPAANDIARVTVQAADRRMCVTVKFRNKPAGHLRIGFTPHSRHAFFPEYVVEIDPSLGVRGGGLTSEYRYFKGGTQLIAMAIERISLYGRSVAFVADPRIGQQLAAPIPMDLAWSVSATARPGSDEVPNRAPDEYVVIRQSDGRVVRPVSR